MQQTARITGISGAVHAVDLWAEGPLGNLAVFLGDEGGIEGPELSALRRAAKDLGATPVVVPDGDASRLRSLASQLGIVVLDARQLEGAGGGVGTGGGADADDPVWGDGDPAWPRPEPVEPSRGAEWPEHSRAAGRRPGEPIHLEQGPPAAGRSLSDQVLDRLTGEPVAQAAPPRTKPARGFGWLKQTPMSGFGWLRSSPGAVPEPDAEPERPLEPAAVPAVAAAPAGPRRSPPSEAPPAPETRSAAPAADSPGPGHWVVDPRRVDEVLANHGQAPPRHPAAAPTAAEPAASVAGSVARAPPIAEPAWVRQPENGNDSAPEPTTRGGTARAEAWITVALWVVAAALAALLIGLLFV